MRLLDPCYVMLAWVVACNSSGDPAVNVTHPAAHPSYWRDATTYTGPGAPPDPGAADGARPATDAAPPPPDVAPPPDAAQPPPDAAPPPPDAAPYAPLPRAVWIWTNDPLVDLPSQADLFDWATRVGIHTLFQQAQPVIERRPEAIRAYLAEAHARGLRVELLFGDPAWIDTPDEPLRYLDLAMALRAEVGDSLAAIHFDVEPHANPGWEADPVPLILAFENFIDTLIARRGASDLPIVLDIPTWFDRTQEPRGEAATLSGWIQQRVDGVVLMAYISDVPTLVSAVETEIPAADALGRSLMVGVQLSCDASPDESLCSAGPGGVEAVDRALQANFRGSPSLRAIALHHYPDARLMWP